MRKKGFTLIELLAVIVILAIIALKATPLVLKYIEKSRKESKVDSAYSFVRNLETEIANYSIKNNGKKYNKAPIGGDYYEFKDFDTDKEIDTTVKGDKPNSIKVCLSSLGQVDKAMFNYGNYYVSYDGKKGSISDKDTYDNFSCGGNVAGGGSGNSGDNTESVAIVKDQLQSFRLTEEDEITENQIYATTIEGDFSELITKLDIPGEVKLIIKDKETKEVIINDYMLILEAGSGMYIMYGEQTSYLAKFIGTLNDSELVIGIEPETNPEMTTGDYYVDLVSSDRNFEPNMFKIDTGGTSWLVGFDFIEGDAHVVITDEDNTEYCNKTIELSDFGYGFFGEMSYGDYGDLGELDNVYQAIANGKTITVKVIQTVDGKEKVIKIIGNNPRFALQNSPMNGGNTYALGNYLFPTGA